MKIPKGTSFDDVIAILSGIKEVQEVFTHIDEEMKVQRSWNVTLLIRYIEENKKDFPIFRIAVTKEGYNICKTSRGYEQHRLDRMTANILREKPVIYIELGNTHLMIDGTHRLMKAYELGWKSQPGYIVKEEVWKYFLVDNPNSNLSAEELLKKDSGL